MTDYHMAEAVSTDQGISHKHSREVLAFIKGMPVSKAINRLNRVLNHEEAIPFKRFNKKIGHRPGLGPGRYPQKTIKAVILLLEQAKNNALNKGLQEEKLVVKEGVTMMSLSKRRRIRARKGGYTGSMKLTKLRVKLIEVEE